MKTVSIDAIVKENKMLMQQIKENREKFWKEFGNAAVSPKMKQVK